MYSKRPRGETMYKKNPERKLQKLHKHIDLLKNIIHINGDIFFPVGESHPPT